MKCYNCRAEGAKRAYKIYDARDLYYRIHFVCHNCFIKAINDKLDHIRVVCSKGKAW